MKHSKIYRYPGVQPFRPDQESIFFGRKVDIEALFELIFTEKVSVLYGKSGYGKSSLLNAGIIPRLIQDKLRNKYNFIPIIIRFYTWSGEEDDTPIKKFVSKLTEVLEVSTTSTILNMTDAGVNLWKECLQLASKYKNPHLIFILDQFEEFFTYPQEMRNRFKLEFSNLLSGGALNEEDWSNEDAISVNHRMEVKVLFSIRSDRLSLLNELSDLIPSVLRKLYELKGLTKDQAIESITAPALLKSNIDEEQSPQFFSEQFEYTPNAINKILDSLGGVASQSEKGVEAFQLQILCQYIENEVIRGNIIAHNSNKIPEVDVADLPDLANIYEAYYRRQIQQLPVNEQYPARLVVEEGLVFLNKQNGEARRLSMDGDGLIQRFNNYGVSNKTLQLLEDSFLLRREINTLGGYNYEISHDTLIVPVLKARMERFNDLEQEGLRKEKEDAMRKQREAERKRRVALLFAIIGILLTVVTTIALLKAKNAEQEARRAERDAIEAKSQIQSALNQVLQKENEKKALQAQDKLRSAEKSIQAGFWDAALNDLEDAQQLDTSIVTRKKIEVLFKQIPVKNN